MAWSIAFAISGLSYLSCECQAIQMDKGRGERVGCIAGGRPRPCLIKPFLFNALPTAGSGEPINAGLTAFLTNVGFHLPIDSMFTHSFI